MPPDTKMLELNTEVIDNIVKKRQNSKFKKKICPSALNDYLTYTDIFGDASEMIQNNCGIMVKPRDSQALVEAIIRLL